MAILANLRIKKACASQEKSDLKNIPLHSHR